MTSHQHRILRRLMKGPIPIEELRKMDQRPLGPMYRNGWFRFDRQHASHITEAGEQALAAYHGSPTWRKNYRRPIFKRRQATSA